MTIWNDVNHETKISLKLLQPEMPRRRRLPARFDDGGPAHQYTCLNWLWVPDCRDRKR